LKGWTLSALALALTFAWPAIGYECAATVANTSGFLQADLSKRSAELSGLSVVVPVYRELHRGNLRRLIRSFEEQTRQDLDLEAVFVVNNTPQVAADPSHPAYLENQETLAWLKAQATTRKVRIVVLDHSTKGIERNIGKIRNLGVRYLQDNYPAPLNRMVGMMDADAIAPENYGDVLMRAARAGNEAFFLGRDYRIEPESTAEVYASFYRFQFEFKLGGTHLSSVAELRRLIRGELHNVFSPQIAATLKALEECGGVPEVKWGEDHQLQKKLMENVAWTFIPRSQITVSDRDRLNEGYVSSFRTLPSNLQRGETVSGTSRYPTFFKDTHNQDETIDRLLLRQIETVPPSERVALFDAIANAEREHGASVREIEAFILGQLRSDPQTPTARIFLEENTWIAGDLQRWRDQGASNAEILSAYRENFPDWLMAFNDTPFKQVVVRLNLLKPFVWEALHRRSVFPRSAALINEWAANLRPELAD